MTRLWIAAASLAAATAVQGAEPSHGIESYYFGWQSVKIDSERGIAFFVAPEERAGNAVEFHMLAVSRDVQRWGGVEFDKQMFHFLGDCQTGTLVRTGYAYQKGNEPAAPPVTPRQSATAPPKDSGEALALAAVCRISQNSPVAFPAGSIKEPYAWAKQRLGTAR